MKTKTYRTDLLKEAAKWRLISLLFECPVGDWREQVENLAGELKDSKLKKAAKIARDEATEGLYHSIFAPGGPAPAREVSYRSWVDPGYLLSDLSGFYTAFGFQPQSAETPDHIAVETAFMAYLKIKEAFAYECDDVEKAEITAQAATMFNDGHLAKMTEQISKCLAASGVDYLALTSAVLYEKVGRDKDKMIRQILPILGEPEDVFECGAM